MLPGEMAHFMPNTRPQTDLRSLISPYSPPLGLWGNRQYVHGARLRSTGLSMDRASRPTETGAA